MILSRDTATAVAQAQTYCKNLHKQLAARLTSNLIIGAADYVFIIAGLTDELAKKLTPGMLDETLKALLPPRCNIIPYDELLRRFESSLPPKALYFLPFQLAHLGELEKLDALARSALQTRCEINDENMTFWSVLEDRWRVGGYIGTAIQRIIDRPYWVISGTDILATESPAHLDFPAFVRYLAECIGSSLKLHRLLARAQSTSASIEDIVRLLTPGAVHKLGSAIDRCRTSNHSITWMETLDTDIDLLERLGLVRHRDVDAGEWYYQVDPLLIKLWPAAP
jgi:hypothetical protein